MICYNKKLTILIWSSIFVILLSVYGTWLFLQSKSWTVLPNNGNIELIDGKNIIIEDNNFSLDLDTFQSIGETQTCTFVFKNHNSASAHVYVTLDYNENYFRMDGIHSFEINPNETYEYKVNIKLTDYPSSEANLPININFQTSYY